MQLTVRTARWGGLLWECSRGVVVTFETRHSAAKASTNRIDCAPDTRPRSDPAIAVADLQENDRLSFIVRKGVWSYLHVNIGDSSN